MQDTWVRLLGWEDTQKEMATTLVVLPGKSHRQRSLGDHSPWGHKRVGHNFTLKTRVPVAGIRSEPELEQLLGFLFFSVSFYPCNAPLAPFTLNFLSGRIHPTHFGRVLPLTMKCGACDLRQACKPRASLDFVLVITCLHMTSCDSVSHPEPSVNYFFYSSYFFFPP